MEITNNLDNLVGKVDIFGLLADEDERDIDEMLNECLDGLWLQYVDKPDAALNREQCRRFVDATLAEMRSFIDYKQGDFEEMFS